MNIQTERLENQIARLTVEVTPEQWESAKKDAARELSKKYRIPGFRKGKAPYNIMVKYVGEANIISEAADMLGSSIYPDVLKQAEVKPYTSGTIEDFQLEPQPTYVFSVPLEPEVELNDYREVRLDFEAPEVSDDEVEKTLRKLQHEQAVVEESANPVQAGDRVTVDIHSHFADGPEEDEEDVEEGIPFNGDNFFHQHDVPLDLDPDDEPILPGIIEALAGAEVDDEREFELTIPEDSDIYDEKILGRKIYFQVSIKSIENVTLPELNDELAARVTKDEEEPLTLLQLRVRVRENLQADAERNANDEYAAKVLDAIVEQADVQFPEAMIEERIEDMIGEFEQRIQQEQQGLTLETYMKITGLTEEQLHEEYHPTAEEFVRRSLVFTELMVTEKVGITNEDIDEQIDEMLKMFGAGAASLRDMFNTPEQRNNVASNLLSSRTMELIAKIGKGEPLDEPEAEDDTSEESSEDTSAEAVDEVETEAAVEAIADAEVDETVESD